MSAKVPFEFLRTEHPEQCAVVQAKGDIATDNAVDACERVKPVANKHREARKQLLEQKPTDLLLCEQDFEPLEVCQEGSQPRNDDGHVPDMNQ